MSRLTHKDWFRAIREEAQRDANAELIVTVAGADGQPLRKTHKSRLFEIEDDGTMIAERPESAVMDAALGVGDALSVMVIHHDQRLMVDSRVVAIAPRQINPHLRMTCFQLEAGKNVRYDQRRNFFRARSATLEDGKVEVAAADSPGRWAAEGRLVNVGGGGIGVVLEADRRTLREIQQFKRLSCRFQVPSDEAQATVQTRLAHVSAVDDTRLYLGLEFVLSEDKEGHAMRERMVQFASWLQRMSLRRRRA